MWCCAFYPLQRGTCVCHHKGRCSCARQATVSFPRFSIQDLCIDPNSVKISWLFSKERCSTLIKCLVLTKFNKEEQWWFQCFQWEKFTDVKSFAQSQTTDSWWTQNSNQIYMTPEPVLLQHSPRPPRELRTHERDSVTSFRRNYCTNLLENTQEKQWRMLWVLIK